MMTQAAAATVSPQEQIMGMLVGVVQGRCIVAAAELDLADALAKGPLPVETIAAQAKADAGNVFRLMRALETIGFFTQVTPRVFANTPLSECLRKDVPGSVWSFARICAPGWVYWDGYSEMLPTLRTGRTTLFETWGYELWEHYRRNPEQSAVFNDAMRTMTGTMTPAVTAAYDWSQFSVIADIGGGIGSQLVDILNAMMTGVGGRERTRDEFATLFNRAGFVLEEIIPTASMFSIVVGRPA